MAGGTSLQVLRLGICASTAGGMVQSRVGEQGFPYAPWHSKKKKKSHSGGNKVLTCSIWQSPWCKCGFTERSWKEMLTFGHGSLTIYACMLSHLSCFWLCVILWTVACQAPLSMGFSRQEHWSGLPCLPPGDLPDPGTESMPLQLLHWQAGSLPLVPPGKSLWQFSFNLKTKRTAN